MLRGDLAARGTAYADDELSDQIDQALRDAQELRGEVAALSDCFRPLRLSGGDWWAA